MTPLPPPLGRGELVFWRLDRAEFKSEWDTGEGSRRVGGRWSLRGTRAVYATLDPATAILEVAVHATFTLLNTVPYVLTSARIVDVRDVEIVDPISLDTDWLRPGALNAGQQTFGDRLLNAAAFTLLPSVVFPHSWNVIFAPAKAAGRYDKVKQEAFALDGRLHPVAPA